MPLLALLLGLLASLAFHQPQDGDGGRAVVAMAFASGGSGGSGASGGRFPWSRGWQGGPLGQRLGRQLAAVRDALDGPYTLRQPQAQQELVQRLLERGSVPPGTHFIGLFGL